MMRLLTIGLVALVLQPVSAGATVTRYAVEGRFPDGQTLSGAFSLDSTKTWDDDVFGSSLTLSGYGAYARFVGANGPRATDGSLALEFYGRGLLSLRVAADYDPVARTVASIHNGPLGVSSLYAIVPFDMFLLGGSVTAQSVPEPGPVALLALPLVLVALRHRCG